MKRTMYISMLTAALMGGQVLAQDVTLTQIEGAKYYTVDEFGNVTDPYGYVGSYGNGTEATGAEVSLLPGGDSAIDLTGMSVFGAYATATSGKPVYNNKVTMSGGEVCTVVGACAVALPDSTAYSNTVIINGGAVKTVYGALSDTADVIGNVVIVSGGTVSCKLTAGDSGSGAVRDNRVYLLGLGGSATIADAQGNEASYTGSSGLVLGTVAAGTCYTGETSNNSIDLYGYGVTATNVTKTQNLNFHLVDAQAGDGASPALTLTGTHKSQAFDLTGMEFAIDANDVSDWNQFVGKDIILAQTQQGITGFGDLPNRKVNVTIDGQTYDNKAVLTLGNGGKDLCLKVLSSDTEILQSDASKQAGSAKVSSLNKEDGLALLQKLELKENAIAGQGQDASMADGLKIESEADLLIEKMTITSNNSISVGSNTITLKDVTIDLSAATYELVENVCWYDLSGLFHCEVDMDKVTFDASDLVLPEGLDSAVVGVGFKFEDSATGVPGVTPLGSNLQVNIGERMLSAAEIQGNTVLFKGLVSGNVPEPATGTLSLLALAALAARRRKK